MVQTSDGQEGRSGSLILPFVRLKIWFNVIWFSVVPMCINMYTYVHIYIHVYVADVKKKEGNCFGRTIKKEKFKSTKARQRCEIILIGNSICATIGL